MPNKRDLKKELSQLYYLNREIEQLQRQLDDLKRAVSVTNSHKAFGCVKGSAIAFPYILHSITVEGLAENDLNAKMRLKSEIADIIKLIQINKEKCVYEYNRLNRYISSVDDSLTRQILTLRFINGLPWQQVADGIGGNNTEDSVKQACSRFLRGQ